CPRSPVHAACRLAAFPDLPRRRRAGQREHAALQLVLAAPGGGGGVSGLVALDVEADVVGVGGGLPAGDDGGGLGICDRVPEGALAEVLEVGAEGAQVGLGGAKLAAEEVVGIGGVGDGGEDGDDGDDDRDFDQGEAAGFAS